MAKPEPTQKIIGHTSGRSRPLIQEVLVSGQEIVFEAKAATQEIKPIDVQWVDSWKEGRLDFYLKPLPEVIREINRYLDNKIHSDDERLNDFVISMDFNIAHRKNFLHTLEKEIPIISHITLDGTITIRKREP